MNMPARASNDSCFDDKYLQKLQSKSQQRGTLVYVWSPRMVYSMQNVAVAARAAAAAGLDFVALHDMRVPSNELLQVRQRITELPAQMDLATPPFVSPLDSSLALCSQKLLEHEALRHFPTAFVITARGMHPQPLVGAMPWGAWVSSIDQRLQQP